MAETDRRVGMQRVHRLLPALLLSAVVCGVVVSSWETATGGFSSRYEGVNAAMWSISSRALREDPIGSKLGATSEERAQPTYTNHPPGIIWATAVSEMIGGEREVVSRSPAIVSGLLLILLLYALLIELGLHRVAASIGTGLALAPPMFRTFGMMLDTPVLGTTAGVAFALVAARYVNSRSGGWLVAAVAGAAALLAWQAAFFVGIVLLGALFARQRVLAALATAGLSVGVAVTVAWSWWANGSPLAVVVAARRWSGGRDLSTVVTGNPISNQGEWLADLFQGVWPLLLVGAVAGVVHPATRLLMGAALTAGLGWMLLFHDGATVHPYWGYWLVVPAAIGVAAAVDALGVAERGWLPAVAFSTVVALAFGTASFEQTATEWNRPVTAQFAALEPTGQDRAWLFATEGTDYVPFFEYYLRAPMQSLDRLGLQRLAKERPDDVVLVVSAEAGFSVRTVDPGPRSRAASDWRATRLWTRESQANAKPVRSLWSSRRRQRATTSSSSSTLSSEQYPVSSRALRRCAGPPR